MSSVYLTNMPNDIRSWQVKWGRLSGAWLLQLLMVEGARVRAELRLGIPRLFELTLHFSFPSWWGSRWWCRGAGETTTTGWMWSDYGVRVSWRKVADLPGSSGGWEWLHIWDRYADHGAVLNVARIEHPVYVQHVTLPSRPATAELPAFPFQHVAVKVMEIETCYRWRAWYIPNGVARHYVVAPVKPIDPNVLGGEGLPICNDSLSYYNAANATAAVASYQKHLYGVYGLQSPTKMYL